MNQCAFHVNRSSVAALSPSSGSSARVPIYFLAALLSILVTITGCASKPVREFEVERDGLSSPTTVDAVGAVAGGSGEVVEIDPLAVQPGFLVEMSQLEDKKLNGNFRIDFDGNLKLPYNVTIKTTNLKPDALSEKIVSSYRPYLKTVESLKISVQQKRIEVEIKGLVNKPGRVLVSNGASLDEILAAAGGLLQGSQAEFAQFQSSRAKPVLVDLNKYYDTGDASIVPVVHGGDSVFFQRRLAVNGAPVEGANAKIRIIGEVKAPGQFAVRRDSDFVQYLTDAGGPTTAADLTKIEIIRVINGQRKSAVYEWEEARRLVSLRDNDVILIHAIKQTPTERTLQNAGSLAAILSAIGVLIIAL